MHDWPPDWTGPRPVDDAEKAEVARTGEQHDEAFRALLERERFIAMRRKAAWIAWYDLHGWPKGFDDYPANMRAGTTRELIAEAKAIIGGTDA